MGQNPPKAPAAAPKVKAVVLDPRPDAEGRPTVPQTWHVIPGLPGFYFPGEPTPIGDPGEASIAAAEQADADDHHPLSIVEITSAEAKARREAVAEQVRLSRSAVRSAPASTGADVDRNTDEARAAGKES